MRPVISNDVFKAAYELHRDWIEISADEALIPSQAGLAESPQRIVEMYYHLKSDDEDAFGFQNWASYKEMRSKFHFIRRSEIWTGFK